MSVSKLLGAVCAASIMAAPAFAQDYPARQITMIIPFSAGGPTDTVARLLAERMSADLGKQIIVENVTGAGGTLGADRVAKADPDGYTMLLHHMGMATSATLYRTLPYDPLNSFDYVGEVVDVPMIITARKDFEPANMAEFIDYVKANAETLTLANAGIGAVSQLCGMLLMHSLDAQLTTVPYKGTGPAMTDLLGSQVDILCDQTTGATQHIQGGSIKAYAATTPERLDLFPDLPTAIESGLPDMELAVWHGIYTPKGTPAEINQRLSQSLQAALADEGVVRQLAELGTEPVPVEQMTPEALKTQLESEIARWKPIIEAAGVYAD
ncbi:MULTISPECIES: tripartite tricarboxylate transporter substrate-binding protein [unclassified Paracoccus (in: a-proteobacteria)]|uniref:tripartite tricarboxylate transporter substrate-binding protein n=1 Tax=unclassified Paracoccus (in: a-proteobacteria) TaxID=2688777 RepID=UPI0015FF1881|nr:MULTISPECIES: tripartite tricarboxylate transporter substrate-binding protein [unclassified Paracoccus (in: a-proteobacteria)]MBB1491972.1 tripartite tricarboxylate transporter substrate binding protein BugD [Paracoccus sp. MC1854]MBB1498165.1 tripartite tricarboxylate transporter substrate binding protein BugD [Paracoccus sp. MC1862]QQO45663.1 tripartite tricarboxylate transporter substrate binding protein BugD [Paracoccus sp. MC1862]